MTTPDPYIYKCTLDRIIDADTVDADIDLGFSIWQHKQRIRFRGIDTPESRTRNKAEKVLGLAAKARTTELVGETFLLRTFLEKGKFGRILGEPLTESGESVCDVLIREGHARPYFGGKKVKWVEE
jgi:micrococcal nuclease